MYNLTINKSIMKRFFVALAAFGLSVSVAMAQDINAAVESFNAGAQALETNKVEALGHFRAALEVVSALEGDDAADLTAKCKEVIPSTLLSIAKEQINDAHYDEALATLEEAKGVAAAYEAAAAAEEVATLVPNVYLRKGSTLLKEKDFAGAVAALEQVTILTPDNGQAFLLYGQALLQSGATDKAIAALTKANEMGQENAAKLLGTTYLKQGQALMKAGKNAEAIEAFEKSNSYAESGNAYMLMANALTKAGKSAKAIDAYKKYLELTPNAKNAADIIFTIAATAQKSGDKATAKEYYGKLAGTKYAAQAEAQLKTL